MGPQLLQGTLIIMRVPCNSWGPIHIREFLEIWKIWNLELIYFPDRGIKLSVYSTAHTK